MGKAAERMKETAAKLVAMPKDERTALLESVGAIVTIEGRALSAKNTAIVLTQMPSATIVGGFRQWQKAGRKVSKGSKGLAILVPSGKKKEEQEEDTLFFVAGTVFDITQTEEATEEKAA